jgi:hypothetical protein
MDSDLPTIIRRSASRFAVRHCFRYDIVLFLSSVVIKLELFDQEISSDHPFLTVNILQTLLLNSITLTVKRVQIGAETSHSPCGNEDTRDDI